MRDFLDSGPEPGRGSVRETLVFKTANSEIQPPKNQPSRARYAGGFSERPLFSAECTVEGKTPSRPATSRYDFPSLRRRVITEGSAVRISLPRRFPMARALLMQNLVLLQSVGKRLDQSTVRQVPTPTFWYFVFSVEGTRELTIDSASRVRIVTQIYGEKASFPK